MEANCLQTDRQTLASYRGARAPKKHREEMNYSQNYKASGCSFEDRKLLKTMKV